MKYLKTYDEKCIGCGTCASFCSNLFFKEDNPVKSCIEVFPAEGADNFRLRVCSQCGICVEYCPADAISINKQGVVMIGKKQCYGCNVCIDYCPTDNLRTHPEEALPYKCTACGACTKECPAAALEVIVVDGVDK